MNKNVIQYLVVMGIYVVLKFWMRTLNNDALTFLLWPTNKLFSLFAGSSSSYSNEAGYYHASANILIDKSCSGYNYLLLCFVILSFLVIKYGESYAKKILGVVAASILSYILTIIANTSRIVVSSSFDHKIAQMVTVNPSMIHEAVGILSYLTFLLLTYFALDNFLIKKYAKPTEP